MRYAHTRLFKPKTHPRSSENLKTRFSDDLLGRRNELKRLTDLWFIFTKINSVDNFYGGN